ATSTSDRAKAHTPAKETRSINPSRNSWRGIMRTNAGAIEVNAPYLSWFLAITSFCVISCATTSRHQFSEPTADWQTKSGQLMYRTAQTELIGDVLVRFSKAGDFDLTVSKGPGVMLLALRQDATFAEVKGPFARGGWSGPIDQAPQQLRGWLGVRDKFLHAPTQKILRYVANDETFLFRL